MTNTAFSPRAPLVVAMALALGFAIFVAAFSIARHDAFQSAGYDLGNVDQAVWNTAHGRPFAQTNIPGIASRLGTHVEPILLLIAPLFWIWDDVRVLLVLQAAVLALGALPLFRFARRRAGSWPAAAVVAAYLATPALKKAAFFDFHAVTLAPTFLLFALDWLDERRDAAFLAAAALAMACKEEIGFLVAMMGLYALAVQRRRFGLIPLAAGAGWSLAAILVIMPHFAAGPELSEVTHINRYAHFGDSPAAIMLGILARPGTAVALLAGPDRLLFLARLLLPTAGLALLAPEILLLAAPSLAIILLSSQPLMQLPEGYHYPAPILPFAAAAAAAGIGKLRAFAARRAANPSRTVLAASLLLLAAALATNVFGGTIRTADVLRLPQVAARDRVGEEIARSIPAGARVSASSSLNPHVSHRERLWIFPEMEPDADTVFLDLERDPAPASAEERQRRIAELRAGGWQTAVERDGWLLLERRPDAAGNPEGAP